MSSCSLFLSDTYFLTILPGKSLNLPIFHCTIVLEIKVSFCTMGGFKHLCEVWLFVLSNLSKNHIFVKLTPNAALEKKTVTFKVHAIRSERQEKEQWLLYCVKKKASANKLIKTLSTFKALKANSNAWWRWSCCLYLPNSFKGCLLTEPMQGTWHLAAESGFVSKHDMTQGDVTRLKEIAQTIKSPV